MPNTNALKLLPLLAAGFLAAPACKLAPPLAGGLGDASSSTFVCTDNTQGDGGNSGAVDGGGGAGGGGFVTITPGSCKADNNAATLALLTYTDGYTQDPANLKRVQDTVNSMSLEDECTQMRGTPYGSAYSTQMTDVERSLDTDTIRGFRYRDASRGMNLAEDMDGVKPAAGTVNGKIVGFATAFPVSMARGAAFDLDLEYAIGEAIGDEMQAAKQTLLLAPCMNILRHPLWGRAQETYGEDSFHIGRLASAMTIGVQQHIAANAKHYMAYDIEVNRSFNDSQLDEQTLREIYGRHFRMVVQDGGVSSVMASYNMVNGTKSTENFHTLTEVLRNDFGFKGFILSDWWAMTHSYNVVDSNQLKAIAVQGVKAGLDVELPWGLNFSELESIVDTKGGLTKGDIDRATARVLEQKFRFNADNFDTPGLKKTHTDYENDEVVCTGTHINLARKAAVESMVLFKNDKKTLPIDSGAVKKVAVIGATVKYVTNNDSADSIDEIDFAKGVLTGDMGSSRVYHRPDQGVGPLDGIAKKAPPGVTVVGNTNRIDTVTAAQNIASDPNVSSADFIVVVAGLTPGDEGEEYTKAGDRASFGLDAKQTDKHPELQNLQNTLIATVAKMGKPMVVVLEGGSVIDMTPWYDNVPAVVMAWYPGMVGGEAMGMLLWGQANFSGKLPFTWSNLGDYPNFGGAGTTKFDYYLGYRYFDNKGTTPLFPFGYGISYTTFEYRKVQLGCSDMSQGAVLPVVVNVANTGSVAGDEIAMVFVSFPGTQARRSAKELKGFARVHLDPGEEKQITIPVRLSDLDYFQADSPTATTGKWVVESGNVEIKVGGRSDNLKSAGTVQVNGY